MCYMSSMFLQLIKTQPVMNYLLYYTIDKIQSTHWINNIRTVKSMVNKDPVSRRTEVPTLFTALIRKTQNIRKSGKQGYKTPVHSRLPFTIWSFLDIWILKMFFFLQKIQKFYSKPLLMYAVWCSTLTHYCVKSKYQPINISVVTL